MKLHNILCIFAFIVQNNANLKNTIRSFPKNFIFGASTSAYQVEGGYNQGGKGLSIWDLATHTKNSKVKDESNGDVAADSFNNYKEDVELLREIGLDFYSFSIAWSRILPDGFSNKINEDGIQYYSNLLDELLKNDIKPFVCIYHWDLPAVLQNLGGWTNPHIADWFTDYAKVLFDNFGDRVHYWTTISSPREICHDGYGTGEKAPLRKSIVGEYICMKNVLIAHSNTYKLYDEKYRKAQKGKIGISLSFTWYEPYSDTEEDKLAANDFRQYDWGMYADPIFSQDGDFPRDIRKRIEVRSYEYGLARSRLPSLTSSEVNHLRGSADFLAMSSFKAVMVYRDHISSTMPSTNDIDVSIVQYETDSPSYNLLQEVPAGFFKLLMIIKKQYNNPPVFILGQDWSSAEGRLDEHRVSYCRNYMNSLLNALERGCNVRGYSVWSLIDNFDWMNGYTKKYGLYDVDFSIPSKKRTQRKSALIYQHIVKSKTLDLNYEPEIVMESESSGDKDLNDVFF